jgi:hypothetical protein
VHNIETHIKAQLSLLEWSKRVRSVLCSRGGKRLPLKDCETLLSELNVIYSSVDKTNKSEVIFDTQLNEEIFVRRTFNEGREWIVSAKDVLTVGGGVRKGASLTRVRELRDSSMLCTCVHLSLEIKPLCDAIDSAEAWKGENQRCYFVLYHNDFSSCLKKIKLICNQCFEPFKRFW